MLIGAHVSNAGGLDRAVERGVERGCEAIQIFNQSPRMWRPTAYTEDDFAEFRQALDESPIEAVLIHAVYLINCATEDADMRKKSLASLTQSLRVGVGIGAVGVVLHPGSAKTGDVPKAIKRAGKVIREALAETDRCPLLLEDTAGAGGTLGRSFEELSALIDAVRRRQAPRDLPRLLSPVRVGLRRPHPEEPRRGDRRVRRRRRARPPQGAPRQRFGRQARVQSRPARDHGRGRARREGLRGVHLRTPVREAPRACSRPGAITAARQRRTWRWRRSCGAAAGRTERARSGQARPPGLPAETSVRPSRDAARLSRRGREARRSSRGRRRAMDRAAGE